MKARHAATGASSGAQQAAAPLRRLLGWAVAAMIFACSYSHAAQKKGTPARDATGANRNRRASTPSASLQVLRARPLAMYYYTEDNLAYESLREHVQEMSVLAPQCFWVDAEGFVRGEVPARAAEAARRARVAVLPLVFNRGFDRATVAALLHNPKACDRAVMYLAYLAQRDKTAGFQIDLENIDPADKLLFTRFARLAAARLHRDGRLLSVAVVPRFSDKVSDAPPAEFHTGEWGAAYDYRALGQLADFLVVMTYDHFGRSGPAGPIAGYDWVKKAVEYAARRVPREKLLVGLPFYGREWISSSQGATTRSLTFRDVSALLENPDVQEQWDARWRSPWFELRDGATRYTVWFEDQRSLGEKLNLMRQFRLRGFAAWRLGGEDSEFWPLAKPKRKETKPPSAHEFGRPANHSSRMEFRDQGVRGAKLQAP